MTLKELAGRYDLPADELSSALVSAGATKVAEVTRQGGTTWRAYKLTDRTAAVTHQAWVNNCQRQVFVLTLHYDIVAALKEITEEYDNEQMAAEIDGDPWGGRA